MDLEIKKGNTTIDFCKEQDGLITIDTTFDDGVSNSFTTISLNKEDIEKVIKQLKEYTQ